MMNKCKIIRLMAEILAGIEEVTIMEGLQAAQYPWSKLLQRIGLTFVWQRAYG